MTSSGWLGGRFTLLVLFMLVCVLCVVDAGRNFYSILDVPKNANAKQIKKAYRKQSMKWHPDRNQGSKDAEARFQEISNAYEVLNDVEKRRVYDQGGEEALKRQAQGGGGGHNPFDIFSQFFGGGGGGGHHHNHHHQQEQRGLDMIMPLFVSLEDLYLGKSFDIHSQVKTTCSHCGGSGAHSDEDMHTCPKCQGRGIQVHIQQIGPGFVQQVQQPCSQCQGKGKIVTKTCNVCKGSKIEQSAKVLDVFLDQHMRNGHQVQFDHSGEVHDGKLGGHVIAEVNILPHKFYTLDGNNLRCTVHVSLKEALVGFERYLTQLDGRKLHLKRDSVTKPNSIVTIEDEGLADNNGNKGHLLVNIVVNFPSVLTADQASMFAKLF